MPHDRETHTTSGSRTITGGLREFAWSKEDLERVRSTDTDSSRAFKKALWLNRFFKNPENTRTISELEQYVAFHQLTISALNKKREPIKQFWVKVNYEITPGKYKPGLYVKCNNEEKLDLPSINYQLALVKRVFFIFNNESEVKNLSLTKDTTVEILF